jgi:hypothetical protein
MVSNCANTGLTSGLDPPLSRRYRSLGGKNEKEDIASLALLLVVLALEGCATISAWGKIYRALGEP